MPSTVRRIYKEPNETARHLKLKKACLDYFTAYDKLMNRPSRLYDIEARRALRAMRKAARGRGAELLSLYSDHQNVGLDPIYGAHDKHSNNLKGGTNNARI